jgi:heme oxygenase
LHRWQLPIIGPTNRREHRLSVSASLADRLKHETRALHAAAERSNLMSALLGGRVERPTYCALLRNLVAIYAALEPALRRHAGDPLLAPVHAPALHRTAALAQDLALLHGAGWAADIALQPAALAYVGRLHELDADRPGLLLAHAYVRYLGDLSGGQMLRRVVSQNAALGGEQGVAFYDFGDPLATRALTDAFRAGLVSITPDAAVADDLVAEAKLAFELHQQLFTQLAAHPLGRGSTGF